MNTPTKRNVTGPAGRIAYAAYGDDRNPAVVMSHSILSAAMMWHEQADLLAQGGYYVLCADTRGHGESAPSEPPYLMEDLVDDVVALLDGLEIEKAHFVGLSLGGMTGFGAGIDHPERFLSLCLCAARADMPAGLGQVWDERIATAASMGVSALAEPTVERWFGKDFLKQHVAVGDAFRAAVGGTSFAGFSGCARAIQKLNYLPQVRSINKPTTMIVGANDGPLPGAMSALSTMISGSVVEIIDGAGHLPNIDRPAAFNRALLGHFERAGSKN